MVLDGLRFANGVALAADESYVAVAETGGRTVVRRWLTGPRAGEVDRLAEDLPGYPDNIARGSDGLIWVTLASPRAAAAGAGDAGAAAGAPAGLAAARPAPARAGPVARGCWRSTTTAGWCTTSRRTPSAYHMVTGVREHDGRVWLGSLEESAVAVLDRT